MNRQTCINIYDHLQDDLSREIFKNLLLYSLTDDVKILDSIANSEVSYFDNDIMPPGNDSEEVFIDAGYLDFKASHDFIKWCGSKYEKIIAFEPNPHQYSACVENSKNINNMVVHPYALWDKETEFSIDNVKVKAVKLDDVLNGEKATFIKADLGGMELNALKGAEQTILKHHPKLAVCLYYEAENAWKIPAYILSLCDDYKFYFRHSNGTIFYAV